ncbi:MAG: hypothetical protein ACLTSX_10990 [Collinsella sp.]
MRRPSSSAANSSWLSRALATRPPCAIVDARGQPVRQTRCPPRSISMLALAGVVPEIASRKHVEVIVGVVDAGAGGGRRVASAWRAGPSPLPSLQRLA